VQRIAEGFGPVARSIAQRATATTPTIYTPVYEVRSESWSAGPAVLIGDAAHAIVPMLAQGAALAIEDALLLAHYLASENPIEAVSAYEQARRPRIEEAAAICGFASLAVGLEGRPDPEVLRGHPGNPSRYSDPAAPQRVLWEGIDAQLTASS
jgi:2-polyprenyl-6-methoxyphenol hydroxylase-like FAD-dependent oxidoreductase